ncbi:hypothetical protein [Alteromonas gracilis]|uniref:hypothetical protein n=1 Tax=Alteromonas gracilis TaxID=1479524 RepID=UPI00321BE63E
MPMSLNNVSLAIIGILVGMLFLAIGPMVECDNLARCPYVFAVPGRCTRYHRYGPRYLYWLPA